MKFRILMYVALAFFVSCMPKSKIGGFYDYKTQCLGVEMVGSQTVKAWGSGRNRADAIEQAYKTAVRDVLFSGIKEGNKQCNVKPIITEVNAQDKYENYFNSFFTDNGEYKQFISGKDGSKYHIEVIKERKKAGSQATYSVIVRVDRAGLISKMKGDGILK